MQRKQLSLRNITHALFDLSRANPSVDISQTFQPMISYYKDVMVHHQKIANGELILKQFHHLMDEQEKRYEKYSFYRRHITNELFHAVDFPPGTMCWRLPILVRDPVNTFHVTASLRQHNILASNHYFPLDKLLYNIEHPNSTFIGSRILNLWVDDLMTMNLMQKTVDFVNSYTPIV